MKQRRKSTAVETRDTREIPLALDIVYHDSHMQNSCSDVAVDLTRNINESSRALTTTSYQSLL